MNTTTSVTLFAAGLAVAFAGAAGIGNAVGPIGSTSTAPHETAHSPSTDDVHSPSTGHADDAQADSGSPEGLSSSLQGYALQLETPTLQASRSSELAFRLLGPGGRAVTAFTPTHDEDLHLIVVRRDGTGFQHLHPERDPAGRWSTPITLPAAGAYKVFADSAPGQSTEALTLAADLAVPGDFQPASPAAASRTAQVDDYTVTLAGDLVAGTSSPLTLSVSRDGRPVTDLEPYLAAYGHLVSLRVGDLAYLHTHPDGAPGDGRTSPGPAIAFGVEVPTSGEYLLYLDFKHEGAVRTATFTASTTSGPAAAPQPSSADGHGEDHSSLEES